MRITINYRDLRLIQRLINDEYLKVCKVYHATDNGQFKQDLEREKNNLKNLQSAINNLKMFADIDIVRQNKTIGDDNNE